MQLRDVCEDFCCNCQYLVLDCKRDETHTNVSIRVVGCERDADTRVVMGVTNGSERPEAVRVCCGVQMFDGKFNFKFEEREQQLSRSVFRCCAASGVNQA